MAAGKQSVFADLLNLDLRRRNQRRLPAEISIEALEERILLTPPFISGTPNDLPFQENDSAIPVDLGLKLLDVDFAGVQSDAYAASVSIRTLNVPACDCGLVVESESLETEIDRLKSLMFVSGSGLYVAPTATEQHAFFEIASLMAAGDMASASTLADLYDYDVVEFTDIATERQFYVLRERSVGGMPTRGWGTYFLTCRPT